MSVKDGFDRYQREHGHAPLLRVVVSDEATDEDKTKAESHNGVLAGADRFHRNRGQLTQLSAEPEDAA